jgi:hypothetical protein|tara:strand:+ start:783 stop:2486 length:1704 start_codon:yes stop_codon:yes gene_type:complete
MAGYTRQSSYTDGDVITAAQSNDEFNQLLAAFVNTTGHKHDGTASEGPVIGLIGDPGVATPINKVVVDDTNNRVGVFVDVGGSTTEQIRFQDGAIVPVTDNDIDLGASGTEFKDLFIDGTANIDALIADTADINGGTIDGVTIGAASAGAITGTTIVANTSINIAGDGATVTGIKDEDDMSSNSATKLATQQSIKAYVDAQVTAQDLDFQADSGGVLSIDLDSETFTLTGGTGIDTAGSGNAVTFAIDSTVTTLAGTQTLTNKTLTTPVISSISNSGTLTLPTSTDTLVGRATTDTLTNKTLTSPTITTGVLNGAVSGTSIKDEDNMASDSASHLATQQSIKAYVDSQVTAQDFDFSGDSGGAQSVDLDSQSLTFTGGTGIDTTGSSQTMTFAIDSTVATLTGSQTLTNKTLTSPVLNSTISGTSIKDEDNMASNSADHLATQQSIKAYVDTQVATVPVGDITSVVAGSGMTGGGTSGDVTLNVIGGTGITANADEITIDSTVTTLTGTQTLTNKTLTSPTINGGSLSSTVTGTTQSAGTNNTTIATTAFAATAADNAAVALAIALG